MSYTLTNLFQGACIGEYIRKYCRGYEGGYSEFRLWLICEMLGFWLAELGAFMGLELRVFWV